MSRSNWSIIVALAGLGALFTAFGMGAYVTGLSYPQEERYQPYRHAPEQPANANAAPSAKANPESLQYRTPCHQPEGQGESDLCAQWRAAKAAEDSATWTKWSVWIGIVGSTLLLWQIILTRKAVEDTGEATEAMQEANEIARRAAEVSKREAELARISYAERERAHIEIVGMTSRFVQHDQYAEFVFQLTMKNIGPSMAQVTEVGREVRSMWLDEPIWLDRFGGPVLQPPPKIVKDPISLDIMHINTAHPPYGYVIGYVEYRTVGLEGCRSYFSFVANRSEGSPEPVTCELIEMRGKPHDT